MPFKRNLALQNIPLSKQPFKTQPQIGNEDVTWSPQYNLPTTRTNKRRVLSLQEVKLHDRFFNSPHCIGDMCCIKFMHKFHMSFVSILIFLDRRLGFRPTLQLTCQYLRALQNENRMRTSILNIVANRVMATMWGNEKKQSEKFFGKKVHSCVVVPPIIIPIHFRIWISLPN